MTYFGLFAAVSVTKNLAGSVKRILIPKSTFDGIKEEICCKGQYS